MNNIDLVFYKPRLCIIDDKGRWKIEDNISSQGKDMIPFTPLTFDGSKNDFQNYGIDIVYNALHGENGEGGPVQSILDQAGVPYTGSSMKASMLTYDKVLTNQIVEAKINDIYVPKQVVYRSLSQVEDGFQDAAILGGQVIIKPSMEGSSFGITQTNDKDPELLKIIKSLLRETNKPVLMQEFIKGREITCGVVTDLAGTRTLPIWEIISDSPWFDNKAKYEEDTEEVHANLDPTTERLIRQKSLEIHSLFGCEGATRIDYRLSNDERLAVIELNSSPGQTQKSIFPQMIIKSGISMMDFTTSMLRFPLERM